ncbi:hypothetical protein AF332_02335 [Sporosarcina globispora]|uniref:Uncharacterized protein n=1 Tax=Sporosarcina globispora TaxID=1459 RepID=A0A0M0G790_SPOGL|nr:hypothetical protein [Sporosarcina globispora]KON85770.1 hypothetical protein AF332_02335 [Sporosarcina globispora]
MKAAKNTSLSLPSPSRWGISTDLAGRPLVRGVLTIESISDNLVLGTANFRGIPIPISGFWDENMKRIDFDTPYATFSGHLKIFDDASIRIRHLLLSGRFLMKPPSLQAGESGNWIASSNVPLTGPAMNTGDLPPVGAFLTSDLLLNNPF